MALKRSSVMCAVFLLMSAMFAQAQTPSKFDDVLEYGGGFPGNKAVFTCTSDVPDSVALVSPLEVDATEAPEISVNGRPRQWPTEVDTAYFKVEEATCSDEHTDKRRLLSLVLRDKRRYVRVTPKAALAQIRLMADGRLWKPTFNNAGDLSAEGIREARQAAAIRDEATRKAARRREYQKLGWPASIVDDVMAGRISIGMTPRMVRAAWGNPETINTTITANGRDEQWVYGDDFVYVTNGKVRAMQTSRSGR